MQLDDTAGLDFTGHKGGLRGISRNGVAIDADAAAAAVAEGWQRSKQHQQYEAA